MELKDLQKNLKELIDAAPEDDDKTILKKLITELKTSLQQLEKVDKTAAEELLASLESTGEDSLFQEVGRLLRRFHDQLVLIREGIPEDLGRIATQDVIEMSERLQMIVTMTDKAANKTLDLTENILDTVGNQNQTLEQISNLLGSELENNSLPESLTKSLKTTIKQIADMTESNNDTQNKLTEILIAQDYQDLTGQVIFKVINLLKTLESDLAQLIDRFGRAVKEVAKDPETMLKGPLSEDDSSKSSQNDVDALLSEFGF